MDKILYSVPYEYIKKKVEVITRSPQIVEKISSLVDSGIDVLNFSLDTIDKEEYEKKRGN